MNGDGNGTANRAVHLAARRMPPGLLIFDRDLAVAMQSPDIDVTKILPRIMQALHRTATEREGGAPTFEAIDSETVLRIVRLTGDRRRFTAVFIERVGNRGSAATAARRYALTKRETEVLALVVQSFTSGQVANRLCIAEATVGDHIKSLMRKMKCTKRSELIARVYNLEHEPVAEIALA